MCRGTDNLPSFLKCFFHSRAKGKAHTRTIFNICVATRDQYKGRLGDRALMFEVMSTGVRVIQSGNKGYRTGNARLKLRFFLFLVLNP